MATRVVLVVVLWLVVAGAVVADFPRPEYKYSCLHYCQSQHYGQSLFYCCRAAEVSQAPVHFTGGTQTASAQDSLAAATSTLETRVTITATPLLLNLQALGAAVTETVVGTLSTTVSPSAVSATLITNTAREEFQTHRGECPPSRAFCPGARSKFPHLSLCKTDYDCVESDKCCYDACLKNYVCKTAVGGRYPRTVDEVKYESKKSYGYKKSTRGMRVILRDNGEPVHVVVDDKDEPVAVGEGDMVVMVVRDPMAVVSGTAGVTDSPDTEYPTPKSPTPTATVHLSEEDDVYVVKDENGDVVMDANDNTLTLVQLGLGPTLLLNDVGMKVLAEFSSSTEFAFRGTVAYSLVPNLMVHKQTYTQETRTAYHITAQGKIITVDEEAPLIVVNSDGVTFMLDYLATENIQASALSLISVVDANKVDADIVLDGDGNVVTDEYGNIVTTKDMTRAPPSPDEEMVIIDGDGNAVKLVDMNDMAVKLTDNLGNEPKIMNEGLVMKLENSVGVAIHEMDDGIFLIIDGDGRVVLDKYGHPLLVQPLREQPGMGNMYEQDMMGEEEDSDMEEYLDEEDALLKCVSEYRKRQPTHYGGPGLSMRDYDAEQQPGTTTEAQADEDDGSGMEGDTGTFDYPVDSEDEYVDEEYEDNKIMDYDDTETLPGGRHLLSVLPRRKRHLHLQAESLDDETLDGSGSEDDMDTGSGYSSDLKKHHELPSRWERSAPSDSNQTMMDGSEVDDNSDGNAASSRRRRHTDGMEEGSGSGDLEGSRRRRHTDGMEEGSGDVDHRRRRHTDGMEEGLGQVT
ncbi:uncharacterized protein LOC121872154 [Homarus americanus]|uniref:uncharacterized protein LOC121872154 n=1 Tax=Homarus americanus TaxID=6706 RepID=UPI001C45382A|nr:uncharacterized protein LOC121872154 [Homarus americanus]